MAWRAIVAAALVAIVAVVVFPSPPTANVILFDNCTFWTGADQVSVQAKHATPDRLRGRDDDDDAVDRTKI